MWRTAKAIKLVLALLAGWFGADAADLSAQDFLYVAVQGEAAVSVIDMDSLEEVTRLDLTTMGFTENAKPHHIAVEPDGSHWYVSLIGENRVLKLDRQNNIVGQVEFEVPGLMALNSRTNMLYVGRSMSAINAPSRIGEIATGDMDVEELDVFFPRPHALAVAPGLGKAYSASLAVNQMGVLDLESGDFELMDVAGTTQHTLLQFAVSPDESTLVVTTEMSGRLLIFDLANPDHPTLRHSVAVGRQPWHPVFAPNGERVYFGNKADNTIAAVDVRTGEAVMNQAFPGLSNPHGAAISPDGSYLFVSNNGPGGMDMDMGMGDNMDHSAHEPGADMDHDMMGEMPTTGTLVVIDLRTMQHVKTIELGENATGVGTHR